MGSLPAALRAFDGRASGARARSSWGVRRTSVNPFCPLRFFQRCPRHAPAHTAQPQHRPHHRPHHRRRRSQPPARSAPAQPPLCRARARQGAPPPQLVRAAPAGRRALRRGARGGAIGGAKGGRRRRRASVSPPAGPPRARWRDAGRRAPRRPRRAHPACDRRRHARGDRRGGRPGNGAAPAAPPPARAIAGTLHHTDRPRTAPHRAHCARALPAAPRFVMYYPLTSIYLRHAVADTIHNGPETPAPQAGDAAPPPAPHAGRRPHGRCLHPQPPPLPPRHSRAHVHGPGP